MGVAFAVVLLELILRDPGHMKAWEAYDQVLTDYVACCQRYTLSTDASEDEPGKGEVWWELNAETKSRCCASSATAES